MRCLMTEIFPNAQNLIQKISPFEETSETYLDILTHIGNARFVLIGEASHGTHEFYKIRAELTKYLIQEKGFNAIAIEGDWPDAHIVHTYLQGNSSQESPLHALKEFKRFPSWMWRNTVVLNFVTWLKEYNDSVKEQKEKIGFYGLDIYSLHSSISAVIESLEKIDSEAAQRARERYHCFDAFGENPETYAYETMLGIRSSCEQAVQEQFLELQSQAIESMKTKKSAEFLYILQNARVVKNAEEYYRSLFLNRKNSSWNLRDGHMTETVELLSTYYDQLLGRPSKIIIWAHNSHIGDARATEMKERGEYNIGQLIREKYGSQVFLLGFTTYNGTVTAASNWGDAAEEKYVNPALPDSFEAMFHQVPCEQFFLSFASHNKNINLLGKEPLLHRAIGVVYKPKTERYSHYFYTHITQQYDAIIHLDRTTALVPLEKTQKNPIEELPETFPFGI